MSLGEPTIIEEPWAHGVWTGGAGSWAASAVGGTIAAWIRAAMMADSHPRPTPTTRASTVCQKANAMPKKTEVPAKRTWNERQRRPAGLNARDEVDSDS